MYVVKETQAREFTFKIGDMVYSIPHRESLPVPTFRELRRRISDAENQEEEAIDAIFDLFEEFAPGSISCLTFEQAIGLIKAYSSDDDGDLGESSPSSD